MVDKLRRVAATAFLCNLEELDLPATFDAVMAIGVLNFVTAPQDTLRRLCNAVRPGGVLVVQVTEWSLVGLAYSLSYRLHGFRPFLFTRRWLCDQTQAHEFTPLGSEHPLPHDLTIAFRRAECHGRRDVGLHFGGLGPRGDSKAE
jgi:SAM-dependent methyltransferase